MEMNMMEMEEETGNEMKDMLLLSMEMVVDILALARIRKVKFSFFE